MQRNINQTKTLNFALQENTYRNYIGPPPKNTKQLGGPKNDRQKT